MTEVEHDLLNAQQAVERLNRRQLEHLAEFIKVKLDTPYTPKPKLAEDIEEASRFPPLPLNYDHVDRNKRNLPWRYHYGRVRVKRFGSEVHLSSQLHPDSKLVGMVDLLPVVDPRTGKTRWFATFQQCDKSWITNIVEFKADDWPAVLQRAIDWLETPEKMEWRSSPLPGKSVFGYHGGADCGAILRPLHWLKWYENQQRLCQQQGRG